MHSVELISKLANLNNIYYVHISSQIRQLDAF